MDAQKCNGPDAANDRPAKTLTKYAADFIAHCYSFASEIRIDRGVAVADVAIILMAIATFAIVFGGAL